MKHRLIHTFLVAAAWAGSLLTACQPTAPSALTTERRYEFADLFDIAYTPNPETRCRGWFTDAGSWMGFTLPEKEAWVNGCCGPFSLDMNRRQWMARAAVTVAFSEAPQAKFTPDSTTYYPGEIYLAASAPQGQIVQRMNFLDASTALLRVHTDTPQGLVFTGDQWSDDLQLEVRNNTVIARHPSGEIVVLTFTPEVTVSATDHNYRAESHSSETDTYIALSFYTSEKELSAGQQKVQLTLSNPNEGLKANHDRWEGYLKSILRNDMEPAYDRIAVKAVTTLISNWRTHRSGLLHEGIVPSHAVGYFVGFWAWDSWRFSAALAKFAPELAKNNIRAMFDYQLPDGMIIDCIYTDPAENNARDSKPPLVCWAVDEIFTHTQDTAFVREMYPQLLAYYQWWFQKRDHDRNGLCEYGSTDGTLEAAAWESGMDNAIRFDDTRMVKNEGAADAWSMDQESVDLNAYLTLECRLLKKFAALLNHPFEGPEIEGSRVAEYFFDTEKGFFFDRRLKDRSFIQQPGCEAYTPLWTRIATPEQVKAMMPLLTDSAKFSTYIPFPTIAADNPKYNPKGYWRGPIWLDQTYFAIRGLRNYGYHQEADSYTRQVFDRLQGLKEGAPIHENYGTHTGERLKAPHFSWSSSHLLMLYDDYGK